MTWERVVDITSVPQVGGDQCAAACAQMILTSFGVRGAADTKLQRDLSDTISNWNGPWNFGNPLGLASVINRYNFIGSQDAVEAPRPAFEYRVQRLPSAYEACATMVDALFRHGHPSAAVVYGSRHWVVIYGASGSGTPSNGSAYSIDALWLLNPDQTLYEGGGREQGFVREHITYESLLYDYFTGFNDAISAIADRDVRQRYGDGRDFIVVTDAAAKPRGRLQLPRAEDMTQGPIPIDEAVLRVQRATAIGIGATRKATVRVWLAFGPDQCYYLVPFAHGGTVDVVRFDENGRYRGSALGLPDRGQFDAHGRQALRCGTEALGIELEDAQLVAGPMWAPTNAFGSPYNPFYVVEGSRGASFAALDGKVLSTENGTGDPVLDRVRARVACLSDAQLESVLRFRT